MTLPRHIVAAALALVVMGFGIGPAVADTDLKRLTLRHQALGWEAVGRLDLADRGFCTGVLIATDLVLTAAHCLLDREDKRIDPRQVVFRAGLRDGKAIAERNGVRAVLHPTYAPQDANWLRQLRSDVALIVLDAPIPAATAAPFRASGGVRPGGQVSLVSYARGRDRALSWQRACTVTAMGQRVMRFSCDADHGSSGAPVFDLSGGRPRIVSLVSRGTRDGGEIQVFGAEIERPMAEVRDALRSGEGVWPKQAFTAKRLQPGVPDTGGAAKERKDIGARFVRP
ncbi:trypsin-like peptidase [Aliiruegeria haliotis]|uniref:Trypsin-like peptidase n=1 Tax=Aliiruegeria haliotis TaxID=1280846 RepID=A0A2T0RRL2_9RHOB|nr:serine protease [Aliiruegeria haliotis]PRY23757.1 trypsin-like peptidase [Aliiruegeria haliotis]